MIKKITKGEKKKKKNNRSPSDVVVVGEGNPHLEKYRHCKRKFKNRYVKQI